ncbi:MAG: ABC transporter substrate-binding protein [Candidatus Latescibacterota bacterium]|nr:ABC transporter substrate-binding protein [Candidatus Latescibacterota bacterium]
MRTKLLLLALGVAIGGCGDAADEAAAWETVQKILIGTKDIVVLDGTEKAPLRSEDAGDPEFGDWMVRHMMSDPEKLNPYTSNDAGASTVLGYVFETLLTAEDELPYDLVGHLAKGYPRISADKLSYTFELREGPRFADGKPLTADDVVFSMKVIKNPQVLAPHLRNYYATVIDVRMAEGNKVTFTCAEPYFRNDISLGFMEILPRHFYDPEGLMDQVSVASLVDGSWEEGPNQERVERFAEQFNQNFNRALLGSGPYMIADVERDVVTGQKVVLSRNPDYWGLGVEELSDPGYVDKVVFKIINNTDAAFIELTNGNIDYHSLRPLEFREKSWSEDFIRRFLKGVKYGDGYMYIGWNNAKPIFRDKRVRQALTHLTDREGMIENLLFGLAESIEGPINKFRPEYNHDLQPLGYDPERALDLLNEAGWADSDDDGILDKVVDGEKVDFRFEILVNSGNQIRKDVALTLQYELQDIGIDCQVRELDWSIFLQKVRGKEFDAVVLGWVTSPKFAPDSYQIWHSSQAENNGSNYISFNSEELDGILDAYRLEFDAQKRIAMYQRLQQILHEEQPYTFLWKSRTAQAYSRRFANVNWYPAGPQLQEWFVDDDNQFYQ